MRDNLLNWLTSHQYPHTDLVVNLLMFLLIIAIALMVHLLLHHGLFRFLRSRFTQSKIVFLNILAKQKLFTRIAFMLQGVLMAVQLRVWLPEHSWLDGMLALTQIWILVYSLLAIFSLLDTLQSYLFRREMAQNLPIGGLVQTIKLIASIAIGLLLLSLLLGKSPVLLLSGLGAMTAVLMLVFKDPILGLVAGIQLSANNMLHLGDWLEMPKYGADGTVVNIGLTTVKVQNWDNTMTTLPTYALIADSFKNWRTMSESGGRRIKRAFFIDAASVHFLDTDEINHLQQSQLLAGYLQRRQEEVSRFNQNNNITHFSPLNGRHLTNIGTFRAYLREYLLNHPYIRKDMTLMVRQLAPGADGLSLELYAFTNTVDWVEYESIQADIFDHIYAVIDQFNLRLYQAPSGHDMRMMSSANKSDTGSWHSPSQHQQTGPD